MRWYVTLLGVLLIRTQNVWSDQTMTDPQVTGPPVTDPPSSSPAPSTRPSSSLRPTAAPTVSVPPTSSHAPSTRPSSSIRPSAAPTATVGHTLCSCTPKNITFFLNFNGECGDGIKKDGGIKDVLCMLPPPDNGRDFIPMYVSNIDVITTDLSRKMFKTTAPNGTYSAGTTINFATSAASEGLRAGDLMETLTITLLGVDRNQVQKENVIIIAFTNSCETYPVLKNGWKIGWIVFNNLIAPRSEYCPISIDPSINT